MNIDVYKFGKYQLTIGPKCSITIKSLETGKSVYIKDGDAILNHIFNGAIVNNLDKVYNDEKVKYEQ